MRVPNRFRILVRCPVLALTLASGFVSACNGRYSCDLPLTLDAYDLDKPFVQVDVTYQCGSDPGTGFRFPAPTGVGRWIQSLGT